MRIKLDKSQTVQLLTPIVIDSIVNESKCMLQSDEVFALVRPGNGDNKW